MFTGLKLYVLIGIAGIAAIVGAILWYNNQIKNAKEEAKQALEMHYKLELEKANARAAQLETSLQTTKYELAQALRDKNQILANETVKTEAIIKTIIKEKPIYTECKVDDVVLEQLNKLRRVGNE
jgi:type II secretory pathway pseudopilin PulG